MSAIGASASSPSSEIAPERTAVASRFFRRRLDFVAKPSMHGVRNDSAEPQNLTP